MNNIDILEEFLGLRELISYDSKSSYLKIYQNAVKNLIAENKKLKEEKDSLKKEVIHWKGEYHLENRKYLDLYNQKVSIPTINATEEMLEQYIEKVKVIKVIEELKDYIQHSANPLSIDNSKFAIKILQSLLGKE